MIELILRLNDQDERALEALLLRRRRWADPVMRTVTHLGGAVFSIALALALLTWSPAEPWRRAGVVAAFALALSHGLVQVIKRTVNRPRPELPVGLDSLARAPDRFSFPSGHAAAALSVAAPVAWALGGPAAWGVVGLALVVGFSRAYLGVHYPGDVVAGWVLALVGAWTGGLLGL